MPPSTSQTLFSGMQPTGELHIGNYLGALKNWVQLQNEYECFFTVVDYHAMTIEYDPKTMPERIKNLVLTYLSAGLDPKKCHIFIQSHIPEHTELAWIFNTITPLGELERMTQFKDKSDQHRDNINAGLLTYPVLMAADILLYKTIGVPVGEDQTQHIELSRIVARKFNKLFGKTFPEPKVMLTPTPRIMSLVEPEKKMSKSRGEKHYIGLFEDTDTIRKKIMNAVTDSSAGAKKMPAGVENLFALLAACGAETSLIANLMEQYNEKTLQYKDLKSTTADTVIAMLQPIQQRRKELEQDPGYVTDVIMEGTEIARAIAQQTMKEVKQKCGLL